MIRCIVNGGIRLMKCFIKHRGSYAKITRTKNPQWISHSYIKVADSLSWLPDEKTVILQANSLTGEKCTYICDIWAAKTFLHLMYNHVNKLIGELMNAWIKQTWIIFVVWTSETGSLSILMGVLHLCTATPKPELYWFPWVQMKESRLSGQSFWEFCHFSHS